MKIHGIEPSQITYGILLDGCINEGQVDKAELIFNSMLEDKCAINTVLYTTLIKGFARTGEIDKAMEVFRKMCAEKTASPDLITFSILMKANCDADRMEVAQDLLKSML